MQIEHFSTYKAQGTLFYSANDYSLLVLFSNKIRDLLVDVAEGKEESKLVMGIEESMNNHRLGLTTSFKS